MSGTSEPTEAHATSSASATQSPRVPHLRSSARPLEWTHRASEGGGASHGAPASRAASSCECRGAEAPWHARLKQPTSTSTTTRTEHSSSHPRKEGTRRDCLHSQATAKQGSCAADASCQGYHACTRNKEERAGGSSITLLGRTTSQGQAVHNVHGPGQGKVNPRVTHSHHGMIAASVKNSSRCEVPRTSCSPLLSLHAALH